MSLMSSLNALLSPGHWADDDHMIDCWIFSKDTMSLIEQDAHGQWFLSLFKIYVVASR